MRESREALWRQAFLKITTGIYFASEIHQAELDLRYSCTATLQDNAECEPDSHLT